MDENQKNYVRLEWMLYGIRSQIEDLVWRAVRMDPSKEMMREVLEVERRLDAIKVLLVYPRISGSEINDNRLEHAN